jgi:3'-phosphoadenosine 5'-phosphosulfate sulfotransferase (PAPS reductase)/FAD synthetase
MTKSEFFKTWQVTKRLDHMSKREKMEALAFLEAFRDTGWHFPMTDRKIERLRRALGAEAKPEKVKATQEKWFDTKRGEVLI